MIRILITGENSYIGTSLENWLIKYPGQYSVEMIDVRGKKWINADFCKYDVIFHVAGIVHIKEKKSLKQHYYKVNRDLPYDIACKAKKEGVKQFVFLSSMSVYGLETGIITRESIPKPKTFYGDSKLQAEKLIEKVSSDSFKLCVLRPPMVYGKGCKGNYPKLSKLVINSPFFFRVNNKRSMIHIDNLCEFIRLLIDNCDEGLFFPQNNEYVNTTELVNQIAKIHKKRIYMIPILNPLIKFIKMSFINKIFGDLIYEKKLSNYHMNYNVHDFYTSIKLTES